MSLLEQDTIRKGRSSQCQNLSWVTTTRGTRWKLSKTVRSMPKKQTDTYQGYITWCHKKIIRKKRTLENLPQPSCTFGRWSAPSIRTIRRSRQRHQQPWTPLRLWPNRQSSSPPNESEGNQQDALQSAPKRAKKRAN